MLTSRNVFFAVLLGVVLTLAVLVFRIERQIEALPFETSELDASTEGGQKRGAIWVGGPLVTASGGASGTEQSNGALSLTLNIGDGAVLDGQLPQANGGTGGTSVATCPTLAALCGVLCSSAGVATECEYVNALSGTGTCDSGSGLCSLTGQCNGYVFGPSSNANALTLSSSCINGHPCITVPSTAAGGLTAVGTSKFPAVALGYTIGGYAMTNNSVNAGNNSFWIDMGATTASWSMYEPSGGSAMECITINGGTPLGAASGTHVSGFFQELECSTTTASKFSGTASLQAILNCFGGSCAMQSQSVTSATSPTGGMSIGGAYNSASDAGNFIGKGFSAWVANHPLTALEAQIPYAYDICLTGGS
jgi:hypothetical protein